MAVAVLMETAVFNGPIERTLAVLASITPRKAGPWAKDTFEGQGGSRVTGKGINQSGWPSQGRDDRGTEPVHQQPHYVADYKARCRAIAEYLYLRLFPHISQP